MCGILPKSRNLNCKFTVNAWKRQKNLFFIGSKTSGKSVLDLCVRASINRSNANRVLHF